MYGTVRLHLYCINKKTEEKKLVHIIAKQKTKKEAEKIVSEQNQMERKRGDNIELFEWVIDNTSCCGDYQIEKNDRRESTNFYDEGGEGEQKTNVENVKKNHVNRKNKLRHQVVS